MFCLKTKPIHDVLLDRQTDRVHVTRYRHRARCQTLGLCLVIITKILDKIGAGGLLLISL